MLQTRNCIGLFFSLLLAIFFFTIPVFVHGSHMQQAVGEDDGPQSSSGANLSAAAFFNLLGRLSGLIGFLFLAALIISGDTARYFDRHFGMDRVIKFQRKFSIATAVFVIAHPIFFILSDTSAINYLIPDFAVVPLALGALALYIFIAVTIASVIYKRISYRAWQYIHMLIYVLFIFSAYHAVNLGSEFGNPFFKYLADSLFLAVAAGAAYRARYKLAQNSLKFVVREVRWETKDVFTLVLKPNRKIPFKSGQFCFLMLDNRNLHARHPFTISSPPHESDLYFTIKLNGRFTKAASELKTSEEVRVEGPFGIFTLDGSQSDAVFIAGGIGITPFMSILRANLHEGKTRKITLIYAAKTKDGLVFKKELDSIKESWFSVKYVLSRDGDISGFYETGHIDKDLIKKCVENPGKCTFYICGPEAMKDSCRDALISLGVGKNKILSESFFW